MRTSGEVTLCLLEWEDFGRRGTTRPQDLAGPAFPLAEETTPTAARPVFIPPNALRNRPEPTIGFSGHRAQFRGAVPPNLPASYRGMAIVATDPVSSRVKGKISPSLT